MTRALGVILGQAGPSTAWPETTDHPRTAPWVSAAYKVPPSGLNATAATPSRPLNALTCPAVATFQRRTTPSAAPVASVVPSGENTMAFGLASPAALGSSTRTRPVAASQKRTRPSSPQVASDRPSRENATAMTGALCDASVARWRPVATSQSRAVQSSPAVASVAPSGAKATALTGPVCPSRLPLLFASRGVPAIGCGVRAGGDDRGPVPRESN